MGGWVGGNENTDKKTIQGPLVARWEVMVTQTKIMKQSRRIWDTFGTWPWWRIECLSQGKERTTGDFSIYSLNKWVDVVSLTEIRENLRVGVTKGRLVANKLLLAFFTFWLQNFYEKFMSVSGRKLPRRDLRWNFINEKMVFKSRGINQPGQVESIKANIYWSLTYQALNRFIV